MSKIIHSVFFKLKFQKEVGCAERVMLERMFVTEEKLKLEQDRLLVNQGEGLLEILLFIIFLGLNKSNYSD
jgi:hypothetical protein